MTEPFSNIYDEYFIVFYRVAESDSEDDLDEKDESDKSDMEEEDTEHARSVDQSKQPMKSHDQEDEDNTQDINLSEYELHKLEKAARTGFKWMKPVFKDIL